MRENYQYIEKLISKDRLEEAIEELKRENNKSLNSELLVLKGRLHRLKEEDRQRLVGKEDVNIERNKISVQVLKLLEKETFVEEDNDQNWNNKYFIPFFLFIVIGFTIFYFKPQTLHESKDYFENDDAYHILLSSFNAYTTKTVASFEVAIYDRIQKLSADHNLFIETRIDTTINTKEKPLGYQEAKSIGNEYKANLVIWGNYEIPPNSDSTLINIKYLTTDKLGESIYATETGETGTRSIYTISSLAQGKLTGNVEDIVLWALGIRACIRKEYEKARDLFKKITHHDENQSALLNQAIAETYIYNKNYEKAIEYLDTAIIQNPNSLIALNNRAVIYSELLKKLELGENNIEEATRISELAKKDIKEARRISINDSIVNKNYNIIIAGLALKNILDRDSSVSNEEFSEITVLLDDEEFPEVDSFRSKEEQLKEDRPEPEDDILDFGAKEKKKLENFYKKLSKKIQNIQCSHYIKSDEIKDGKRIIWTEPQVILINGGFTCNIRFVKNHLGVVGIFSTQNTTLKEDIIFVFENSSNEKKEFENFINANTTTGFYEKTFPLNQNDLKWFVDNNIIAFYLKSNIRNEMKKYSISKIRMKILQDYAACFLSSIEK